MIDITDKDVNLARYRILKLCSKKRVQYNKGVVYANGQEYMCNPDVKRVLVEDGDLVSIWKIDDALESLKITQQGKDYMLYLEDDLKMKELIEECKEPSFLGKIVGTIKEKFTGRDLNP